MAHYQGLMALGSTKRSSRSEVESEEKRKVLILGDPKLRALGVLRLRPPTLAVKGMSSSWARSSSSFGGTIRHT